MRPSRRPGVWRTSKYRYWGTTTSTSRSTSRTVKDQLSRRGVCWKLQGLQSTSLARATAARLTTCRRLPHRVLSSQARAHRATMEAPPGAAVCRILEQASPGASSCSLFVDTAPSGSSEPAGSLCCDPPLRQNGSLAAILPCDKIPQLTP